MAFVELLLTAIKNLHAARCVLNLVIRVAVGSTRKQRHGTEGQVNRMSNLKITRCTGEGQGSCKRCLDNGKWNRTWMCFLYKIEGYEGCYCSDCVKEIKAGKQDE